VDQEKQTEEILKDQEVQEAAEETAAEEIVEEAVEETCEECQEAEGCEAEEAEGEEKESESKSFFKKKKKEDKKDQRIAELEDRVKRQLAEFENFRNRTEKEKTHMYEVGARDIIEKILPVVDNFERGLAVIPEDQRSNPYIEGMDKIYKQLMTALSDMGVKPIEAVGQEFNPNFHNAVMHVDDEELGDNIIAEEFQKGYTYRESVIRYSMVKVAN